MNETDKRLIANSNVMIIDDFPTNLELIIEQLRSHNINLFIVHEAKNAFEAVKRDKPDLVLLDIAMPEVNGFEICTQIKSDSDIADIPIIFLTALMEKDDILKGFQLGAVDYITKPFNREELISRVITHLKLKKAQAELLKHTNNLDELVKKRTMELEETNMALRKEIKERKKAELEIVIREQHYRTLFDLSPDTVITLDLTGKIELINKTGVELFGFKKEDEVLQNSIISFFHPEDKHLLLQVLAVAEKHRNYELNRGFEHRIIRKNNEIRYIESKWDLIKNNIAKDRSILLVSRDITQSKIVQRQILSTTIKTEEKERSRLAKDLHDGLGALLSTIKLYLNMIISDELNKNEIQPTLAQIFELITMAIRTTKEISANIKPAMLLEAGLVKSVENFCHKLNQTGLICIDFNAERLNYSLDENTQIILFRIINELINNTLKHAKAQNAGIILFSNYNRLNLIYTDNGCGFDIDAAMAKYSGSMGLANIQNRLKSIQGKCLFDSKIGQGMKAEIELLL